MVYYPITLIWHDMTRSIWAYLNMQYAAYITRFAVQFRFTFSIDALSGSVWCFSPGLKQRAASFADSVLVPLAQFFQARWHMAEPSRDTYGIPMGYLWDTYGIPMGYLRWPEVPVASVAAAVGPSIGTCLKGSPRGWLQPLQLMTYWWHVDHINPRSQRPLNAARHNGAPKPIR